jgi:hypothetical protein
MMNSRSANILTWEWGWHEATGTYLPAPSQQFLTTLELITKRSQDIPSFVGKFLARARVGLTLLVKVTAFVCVCVCVGLTAFFVFPRRLFAST